MPLLCTAHSEWQYDRREYRFHEVNYHMDEYFAMVRSVCTSILLSAVNVISKHGSGFFTANFAYNEKLCVLLLARADDT